MNLTVKISKIVLIVCMPIAVLFSIVSFVSSDIGFYLDSFKRNGTEAETGYSLSELKSISFEIIDYLQDDREDFNIKIDQKEVFNEREIIHMKDVKELFYRGTTIRNITALLTILSLILLVIKDRKSIGKAFIYSSLFSLGIIAATGILVSLDFDKAFTLFHLILFNNDLWLLDPNTDLLIQMLPLDFFIRMALKIFIFFVVSLIFLLALGTVLSKRCERALKLN